MSVNGEIHNAYNLYIITNTVTIVPRGNFTKERNNFQSIEQRNNSSTEETLKTAYLCEYVCMSVCNIHFELKFFGST